MGNCCSTESTDPTAHAHTPHAVAAPIVTAANAATNGASSVAAGKSLADKPPPQQQVHAADDAHGVDVVKDPLAEPAPSSTSSSSDPLHQSQSPPRSASKKSVASGRTHEGPGPTHSLRIGNYNLRYAYYSKRGYYPEGELYSAIGVATLVATE